MVFSLSPNQKHVQSPHHLYKIQLRLLTHSTWIKINQNPKKGLAPHEGYGKLHRIGETHSPRKSNAMREFLPTGQK